MQHIPAVGQQGWIFNIQPYSLHDGPGIRTIVFLKGCPLSCHWCSNPESQHPQAELAYNANKCITIKECGFCLKACTHQAIDCDRGSGKIAINRSKCEKCFACAAACPAKSLEVLGRLQSVDDILAVVEAESSFYTRSGGGMTLSGGEPLSQGEFALALLKESKMRRINTAMETCGFAPWTVLASCCDYLDTILFDIKCFDRNKHQQFTGQSNELILENFVKLCDQFPDLSKIVRTPLIPGFNDNHEDIAAITHFIKGRPNVSYELLPYHRMGQDKYQYLGRTYLLADVNPKGDKTAVLTKMIQAWFATETN